MPDLIEEQLRRLGIVLPPAPKAVGAYVTVARTGNLVVTSGQLPWRGDKLLYTGKLGTELSVEQGYERPGNVRSTLWRSSSRRSAASIWCGAFRVSKVMCIVLPVSASTRACSMARRIS